MSRDEIILKVLKKHSKLSEEQIQEHLKKSPDILQTYYDLIEETQNQTIHEQFQEPKTE